MDTLTLALYIHSCYTGSKLHWSVAKDEKLIAERGASFAELAAAPLVEILEHPRRPGQMMALVVRRDYVWAVAFVVRGDEIFLKTAYPSRAYTKRFLRGRMS